MCSHPAENSRHGTHGCPLNIIQRRVISNGGKELVDFSLVRIDFILHFPNLIAFYILNTALKVCTPFRSLEICAAPVPRPGDMPDLAIKLCPIWIFILDKEMIKDVPMLRTT